MKYWAYKHANGSLHLKVFRGDTASVNDAFDSPFVDDVMDVFEAENREDAILQVKTYFNDDGLDESIIGALP